MRVSYPIRVPGDSPFTINNIPFGVFSTADNPLPRPATAIGDWVLDLQLLETEGLLPSFCEHGVDKSISASSNSVFSGRTLNTFASKGTPFRTEVRQRLIDLLSGSRSRLFTDGSLNSSAFTHIKEVKTHLPMDIPDFTDFLCSSTHAENCAHMVGQQPHPSFYSFPTAYNGRTSSVVISGTPITRPKGMIRSTDASTYVFSPTQRLDFELEMGIFISKPVPFGVIVDAEAAHDHIFGIVLLNDWSSRDVQFAEMTPLGPFNGKAFATSISPWVVTPEALSSATSQTSVARARNGMSSLAPHLQQKLEGSTWNIGLEVHLQRGGDQNSTVTTLCKSNLNDAYWSPAQMLAHQSSSGCGMRTGDLLGTGTISAEGHTVENPKLGCLFELTEAGKKPVAVPGGKPLDWLQDGDEIVFHGWVGEGNGPRIGLGDLRGLIVG